MSSLARTAARVIRKQLRAHVAWLPLANNFQLGDFGVISGGIFTRLGNVRNLGCRFGTRGTDGAPFEFRSGGTTEVEVGLDARANVSPGIDAEAGLRIGFASANALYLRAAQIEVNEIDELLPVAGVLRNHSQWRLRYRVVHRIWTARDAIFITSAESDAPAACVARAIKAWRSAASSRSAPTMAAAPPLLRASAATASASSAEWR